MLFRSGFHRFIPCATMRWSSGAHRACRGLLPIVVFTIHTPETPTMFFLSANPAHTARLTATARFAGLRLASVASDAIGAAANAGGLLWRGADQGAPRAIKGSEPGFLTFEEMYRGASCTKQSASFQGSEQRGRSGIHPG